MTNPIDELIEKHVVIERTLSLFLEAAAGIGADSYDGIEDRYALKLQEAAGIGKHALAALTSLQEQKRKLEEALTKAAERFREYERSHAEKALEFEHSAAAPCPACQRLDKADRNRVMAEMCEALLSGGGE